MSTVSNWRGPNIVNDQLVLYYDASSPNSYSTLVNGDLWKDISGNGNNGNLINTPTLLNNNGGAFKFDGLNEFVNSVDAPLGITGYNFSLEFVFYYNNNSYDTVPILGKRSPLDPFNQYSCFINNGNPYGGGIGKVLLCFLRDDNNINGSTNFDRSLTYTFSAAGIYHIVLTNEISKAQLWVNNNLENTNTNTLVSGNFNIGGANFRIANVYTTTYWDEKIYQVRLYKKTLSSVEVNQNYNAIKTKFDLP